MADDSLFTIPEKWEITTVGTVYAVIGGGTPTTSNDDYWGGHIPWITSADIKGVRDINVVHYITPKAVQESATNQVPAGTLLVVTRVGLGKIAIAEKPICFSQDLQGLVQRADLIVPEYSLYYLSFMLQRLKFEGRGTTISGLTKKQLKDTSFPLAPYREQCRVVAKIEQLFSELDRGIESLKTARQELKVYRQAVLKYAFEGKLTAQWRNENKDKLEPANNLVTRIQNGREARYEQQLANWKIAVNNWEAKSQKGKKPSKPKPPSFATSFDETESNAFSRVPNSWCWVKFGEIFSVHVGATPSRKRSDFWGGSINWISSGEVCFRRINAAKEKITQLGLENTSTELHPAGTVLLGMIGEGKTRGQASITDVIACHNQNTAAIRVSETDVPPGFVYYYLLYRYEETRRVGSGNNQKALNKERVSNLPMPFPPLKEQSLIVETLEASLSAIERVEAEINAQIVRESSLRHSILKNAFEGQLVPHDPNDEPASVLLERIKAGKAEKIKDNKNNKMRDAA